MNDATLKHFRDLAEAMRPNVPHDWQWIGAHMSQRMFGITEQRAKEYAARHGGEARQMPPTADVRRPTQDDPAADAERFQRYARQAARDKVRK